MTPQTVLWIDVSKSNMLRAGWVLDESLSPAGLQIHYVVRDLETWVIREVLSKWVLDVSQDEATRTARNIMTSRVFSISSGIVNTLHERGYTSTVYGPTVDMGVFVSYLAYSVIKTPIVTAHTLVLSYEKFAAAPELVADEILKMVLSREVAHDKELHMLIAEQLNAGADKGKA